MLITLVGQGRTHCGHHRRCRGAGPAREVSVMGGAAWAIRRTYMTRLILTTDSSGAGNLLLAGIAHPAIPLSFRFVGGPFPSASDLSPSVSTPSKKHDPAPPPLPDASRPRHEETPPQCH